MNRFVFFTILFRYLGLKYLTWVVFALGGLTAVVSLIQAVELMRRIGANNENAEDASIMGLTLLNIPAVIELTLPFALLAGSMLCFQSWNKTNEFVVIRGFGRSIWSVLSSVVVAAGVVGLTYVLVINPIGSVTARQYEAKMNSLFGKEQQQLSVSADGIWLRDTDAEGGYYIIHGNALKAESSTINNPILYGFDDENRLIQRIMASNISLTDMGWLVENAREYDMLGTSSERGTIIIPTELGSLELERSSAPANTIPIFALPSFIRLLERAGLPSVDHRIYLHKMMALPILMIGIAMIAARATLTNLTRGRRVHLFTRGVSISVTIFLFGHFMQVLGSSLRLPAMVAGWAPALVVILIGAAFVARIDET